jgi:hypothetical protein
VIFNETLTFLNIDYQDMDSILKIQVFDKDIQKADDLMGQYDGDLTYAQVNSQVLSKLSPHELSYFLLPPRMLIVELT